MRAYTAVIPQSVLHLSSILPLFSKQSQFTFLHPRRTHELLSTSASWCRRRTPCTSLRRCLGTGWRGCACLRFRPGSRPLEGRRTTAPSSCTCWWPRSCQYHRTSFHGRNRSPSGTSGLRSSTLGRKKRGLGGIVKWMGPVGSGGCTIALWS